MKTTKDFATIVDSVRSKPQSRTSIADTGEDKAVVYKLLKAYTKLPFNVRKAVMPSIAALAGTLSTLKSDP